MKKPENKMALMGVIQLFGRSLLDQFTKGISLFWLGPGVVALIVIPEFAQHVAEIQLGMFEKTETARTLGADPVRWAFGYVKIAGLILALLASARFWWCASHGGHWYDVRRVAWKKLLIGLTLFVFIGLLAEPFASFVSKAGLTVLRTALSLLSLPFLFLAIAGLFGDGRIAIANVWRRSWLYLLLLAVLLVVGFGPAQYLHGLNHRQAIGAPETLVWMLMTFDAFVVGLLASLVGAGIAVSYMAFRDSIAEDVT